MQNKLLITNMFLITTFVWLFLVLLRESVKLTDKDDIYIYTLLVPGPVQVDKVNWTVAS